MAGMADAVNCPLCGNRVDKPVNSWQRGPKEKPMNVDHYVCSCGQSFVTWLDPKTKRRRTMPGRGPRPS